MRKIRASIIPFILLSTIHLISIVHAQDEDPPAEIVTIDIEKERVPEHAVVDINITEQERQDKTRWITHIIEVGSAIIQMNPNPTHTENNVIEKRLKDKSIDELHEIHTVMSSLKNSICHGAEDLQPIDAVKEALQERENHSPRTTLPSMIGSKTGVLGVLSAGWAALLSPVSLIHLVENQGNISTENIILTGIPLIASGICLSITAVDWSYHLLVNCIKTRKFPNSLFKQGKITPLQKEWLQKYNNLDIDRIFPHLQQNIAPIIIGDAAV